MNFALEALKIIEMLIEYHVSFVAIFDGHLSPKDHLETFHHGRS